MAPSSSTLPASPRRPADRRRAKARVHQEAVQASFVLRRNASNPHSPPLAEQPYKIELSDGSVVEGITDAEGRTSLAERDAMHIATISAGSKA
jgi:uncharacterized protein (DUF2345 family)